VTIVDPELSQETPVYRSEAIDAELNRILQLGNLSAALLVDTEGLAMAGTTKEQNKEQLAAMASIVMDVVNRAQSMLQFERVDEVSLVDNDRTRLVCRPFVVSKREGRVLILAVLTPPNQSYRRLTAQAVRNIKKIYNQLFKKKTISG
jgi:predicted regulator of Ras-like GTPase activity (Roadblock/LC7/MglB family)